MMQARVGQSFGQTASPVARWLDGTLLAAEAGGLTVSFVVREEMTNPMGILHGGISATMMDDVLGATVFSLGSEFFYTTVNLNADYLGSARAGETITVTTHVVRQGRNVVHAEAKIHNAAGKLLVKSTSNLLVTSIPTGIKPGQ